MQKYKNRKKTPSEGKITPFLVKIFHVTIYLWQNKWEVKKMSVLLEMKGIQKSFYGNQVLHSVDFSLEAGSVHALMGENGAGKSTLMNILIGIHKRNTGHGFM